MARKYGKGSNLGMAQLLSASMLLGSNDPFLMKTLNSKPMESYPPQRFVKGPNYYKKDDGHGGEGAKKRRMKQMLKMPPHEIVKQHHASL